jgi:thiol:disulfide interchange protein
MAASTRQTLIVLGVLVVLGVVAVLWQRQHRSPGSADAAHAAIGWQDDISIAMAQARATHRPVLAYFTADWCPPCQAMNDQTWPDKDLQRTLRRDTVPLRIDVDRQGTVARDHGVSSIPTMLLMSSDGQILSQHVGFIDPGALQGWIASQVPPQAGPADASVPADGPAAAAEQAG